MDFLTKTGPVEVERLFIIEPEGISDPGADEGPEKPSVDLIIK